MNGSPTPIDDLDRRIIDVLTVDARVSNRQIAARLGVTEGTIRGRIRRLEETGLIDSKWEKAGIAQREQRPPRKYYDLTPDGKDALAEAVKRYRHLENIVPHASKIKPSRQRG